MGVGIHGVRGESGDTQRETEIPFYAERKNNDKSDDISPVP
jgi:hypothetical protein